MHPEPDLDKVNRVLASFEKLVGLIDFLRGDTIVALTEMQQTAIDDPKLQYRKRTFVRTAYAFVEGTCHGMRAICKEANEIYAIDKLSPKELSYILELP